MAEITLEKILADAKTLPRNEQEALVDALLMPVIRPRKTIEQLAAEQGKKPVDFDEYTQAVKIIEDFWFQMAKLP